MMLSDSLNIVTLQDLQWAVNTKYQTDIKWVIMNVVSILSNKSRIQQNKVDFKLLTGNSLYVPKSSPASNWSGWSYDIIRASSVITGKPWIEVSSEIDCLFRSNTELSIRMRRFSNNKKNPVYGESEYLKKDEEGNLYVWDYYGGKLSQLPELYLKQQLIMWEEYIYSDLINTEKMK